MTRTILFVLAFALTGCLGEARLVETREAQAALEDQTELRIDTGAGELFVEGVDGLETVEVEVDLMSGRHLLGDDDRARDALEVSLTERDDETLALLVALRDAPEGYHADVRVRLPRRLAVDVDDGSGDTDIHDVEAVRILDGSGEIVIARVGAVEVTDGSGDLVVEDAARVDVQDSSGEIHLERITGDVQIDDGSGDIQLTDIGGTATVRDGSGDIHARSVGDLVVAEDGSGRVSQQ